jgi:hypothetical protein
MLRSTSEIHEKQKQQEEEYDNQLQEIQIWFPCSHSNSISQVFGTKKNKYILTNKHGFKCQQCMDKSKQQHDPRPILNVGLHDLCILPGHPLIYPYPENPFNMVFMQAKTVGLASYHFLYENNTFRPYIGYHNAHPTWKLENGTSPPIRKYFENPSYNTTTRRFTGTITWQPVKFHGDAKWEYEFTFTPDFLHISHGQVQHFTELDDEQAEGTTRYGEQYSAPNNVQLIYERVMDWDELVHHCKEVHQVVSFVNGLHSVVGQNCIINTKKIPIDILRRIKGFMY